MEDTLKKTILIINFSHNVKSKNNPDFLFDICEYMIAKKGKDKDGNEFVSYSTQTAIQSLELGEGVDSRKLTFGAVCVGEFGEVYNKDKGVNVLGLVGISNIKTPSPLNLESIFLKK